MTATRNALHLHALEQATEAAGDPAVALRVVEAYLQALAPEPGLSATEVAELGRFAAPFNSMLSGITVDWWPDVHLYVYDTPTAIGGCESLDLLGKIIRGAAAPWRKDLKARRPPSQSPSGPQAPPKADFSIL